MPLTACLFPAAFQSVLTNCSATSNVVCGCESGHFRQCHNSACSEFSCQQCEPCAGRLVQRSCECPEAVPRSRRRYHLWPCHPA